MEKFQPCEEPLPMQIIAMTKALYRAKTFGNEENWLTNNQGESMAANVASAIYTNRGYVNRSFPICIHFCNFVYKIFCIIHFLSAQEQQWTTKTTKRSKKHFCWAGYERDIAQCVTNNVRCSIYIALCTGCIPTHSYTLAKINNTFHLKNSLGILRAESYQMRRMWNSFVVITNVFTKMVWAFLCMRQPSSHLQVHDLSLSRNDWLQNNDESEKAGQWVSMQQQPWLIP